LFTRRYLFLLVGILFAATMLFTFSPAYAARTPKTPQLSTTGSTSCPPTESKGASNNWVRVIQYQLNNLKYHGAISFPNYPLATDGNFGTNTYNAVVALQNSLGLTVDGSVGPQTWSSVGLCDTNTVYYPSTGTSGGQFCPPSQSEGNSNTFVNAIQHMINVATDLGYVSPTSPNSGWYPLSMDGSFGTNTFKGVKNFQAANNLSQDGIVGPLTWGAMGMCYS